MIAWDIERTQLHASIREYSTGQTLQELLQSGWVICGCESRREGRAAVHLISLSRENCCDPVTIAFLDNPVVHTIIRAFQDCQQEN
jgi:hypothetical protein